ncbi:glycosyl transferase [Syncephalis plumigaleata]|nr:glycosyl transferase [Syncephalis plumigaleata]
MSSAFVQAALVGSLLKLLLIPSYRSTDFDVHRNWLAITHTLPVSQWYYEATSEWTLDYPPFFAWFEYLLSLPTTWIDPRITVISALPYQSWSCVLYQRITVILTDGLLYYALHRFIKLVDWNTKQERIVMAASVFLNLMMLLNSIDLHIHFQYNGFLYGILVMSIVEMIKNRPLHSATWFAILLNFKHIFLYLAPAYFIYLLRAYCFPHGWSYDRLRQGVMRTATLGGLVIGITLISFGPFLVMGQLGQVISRLFPFKRGLCHAYWAPNFWALYSFIDRFLLAASKYVLRRDIVAPASMTRGLVGDTSYGILPDILPWHTFALTLLFQLPALVSLFKRPTTKRFVTALVLCGYASFLFGWHVHEKAVLLMIIPLSLMAIESKQGFRIFVLLSAAGHLSLLPLLFTPAEGPTKIAIISIWSIIVYTVLGRSVASSSEQDTHHHHHRHLVTILGRPLCIYLVGLIAVQTYAGLLHSLLFGIDRLAFLPLMLLSVYCAVGVIASWFMLYYEFLQVKSSNLTVKKSSSHSLSGNKVHTH